MAGEQNPVEIVGLALEPIRARIDLYNRRYWRVLVRFDLDPDAAIEPGRKQMVNHIETPVAAWPIDRGYIDKAPELASLIIAQKACDFDDCIGIRPDRQFAMRDLIPGDCGTEFLRDHRSELPESIIHSAVHRSMVPVRRIFFCR